MDVRNIALDQYAYFVYRFMGFMPLLLCHSLPANTKQVITRCFARLSKSLLRDGDNVLPVYQNVLPATEMLCNFLYMAAERDVGVFGKSIGTGSRAVFMIEWLGSDLSPAGLFERDNQFWNVYISVRDELSVSLQKVSSSSSDQLPAEFSEPMAGRMIAEMRKHLVTEIYDCVCTPENSQQMP